MRSLVDVLERHANAVYWSDGLLDLLAGATLVLIGVAWLSDLVVFGAITPALVVPLWAVLRRRVVEPRRGYLKLGEQRQQDQHRLLLGSLVAGVGGLLLGVLAFALGVDSPMLVRAMPGSLVGLLALATGAALGLPRFAVYALALVGVGVGSGVLGFNPGWAFVAGGILSAGVGVGLLGRFLRRFPVAAELR